MSGRVARTPPATSFVVEVMCGPGSVEIWPQIAIGRTYTRYRPLSQAIRRRGGGREKKHRCAPCKAGNRRHLPKVPLRNFFQAFHTKGFDHEQSKPERPARSAEDRAAERH